MTTSNDPRGRLAELYSASQTALITPAASPGQTFQRRHFYDWTPSPQEEPQDDELMGGGFANSIDARPAAPDIHRASLRVAWPLDLVQIGFVLSELLGLPQTTGTGPYVHTFDSATTQVPSRTFERKLAAGQFDGATGAVARSLQFPIGSDRGYTRVTADYFAREALEQYGVSIAGSPETPSINSRVPRAVGTIKRGGTLLAAVISGDATIANVLGEDSYAGSKFVDDVALEGRTAAINITGRFKGAAMRDLGKVPVGGVIQDASDFDLEWTLSPSLKLVLTIRNVRFARVGIGTSGPGRLDVPLRGRAEIGGASSMVTAVLTNSLASYT